MASSILFLSVNAKGIRSLSENDKRKNKPPSRYCPWANFILAFFVSPFLFFLNNMIFSAEKFIYIYILKNESVRFLRRRREAV